MGRVHATDPRGSVCDSKSIAKSALRSRQSWVNYGKAALCCSEAGKGIGPAPTWSIVCASVRAHCREHIALDGRGRRISVCEWRGTRFCRASRLIKQESICSTSGEKTGVCSSADPLDELGWAMGMLHETGAGRSSVRDAAYNKSRVARSEFTRGRTTSCNSQRGLPAKTDTRGHARRRNACRACVFHSRFEGPIVGMG